MKPIHLPEPKTCSCGAVHLSIPEKHVVETRTDFLVGYYWNCACNSTLFYPLGKIVRTA